MEGNEAKGANIKEDKMVLSPLRCLRRSSRGVCIFEGKGFARSTHTAYEFEDYPCPGCGGRARCGLVYGGLPVRE